MPLPPRDAISLYPVLQIRQELCQKTNWPSTIIDVMVDRLVQAMEKTLTVLSNSGWTECSTQFEIRAEVKGVHQKGVLSHLRTLTPSNCEIKD